MGELEVLEKLGLDEPSLPVAQYGKMSRDQERDYVQNKYPFFPQSFLLKLDVPRRGITITRRAVQKLQDPCYGKGPRILFQWHHEDFTEEYAVPIDMRLNDGTGIVLQVCPPEIGDPYTLDLVDDKFYIFSGSTRLEEVDFFPPPAFEREGKTTRSGVPLNQIGQVSGKGMLLIPNSHCQYWNEDLQCRFCDMDYNARQAMKMARGWKVRLKPDDVYDLISEALKEKGRWIEVLMTGGSNPKDNFEREFSQEIDLLEAIRKAGEPYEPYRMPVYMISTPFSTEQFRMLKDAGCDAYGGYIETWKKEHWELVCPGKAKYFKYEDYIDRVLGAVDVFGAGNVNAGFVIGVEMAPPPYGFAEVDEAVASTLEGYGFLIKNKVVPMGTNWCIQPGTDFYKMGAVQPPLEFYAKMDIGRYRLLMEHWDGWISADEMQWQFQCVGSYTDWQRLL